ncbi:DUF5955 family protein [Streptomyces sp. NPDC047108]|uniref:DUF5955 family protein n=1 Tax=Streptomyces sp. NPDC047108 TaxID=3155025 RepID=UPI0033D24351
MGRSNQMVRGRPTGTAAAEGAVAVEQRRTAGGGQDLGTEDPRVAGLCAAVSRLRRELAAHPADLSDRAVAEDELATLDAMARAGAPEVPRLRRSLLLVAGALGSVSALAPALSDMRTVIDSFSDVPCPRSGD